jgi:hypothetical protein
MSMTRIAMTTKLTLCLGPAFMPLGCDSGGGMAPPPGTLPSPVEDAARVLVHLDRSIMVGNYETHALALTSWRPSGIDKDAVFTIGARSCAPREGGKSVWGGASESYGPNDRQDCYDDCEFEWGKDTEKCNRKPKNERPACHSAALESGRSAGRTVTRSTRSE